jgi:hypothetical protein
MMKLRWVYGAGLLLLLFTLAPVYAQSTDDTALTADEILILENINEYRRTSNVVYLSPNPILNHVAQVYESDLSSRSPAGLGNVYVTNGQSIDDILQQEGYLPYSDGYVVDFIPLVIRDIMPDKLIAFILQDANSGARTVKSRKMSLGQVNNLPFSEKLYREIGLAYTYNSATQRYTYVIVVASQPNVLPVMITTEDEPNVIAQSVTSSDVTIRIQNEYSHIKGDQVNDQAYIGRVTEVRLSNLPGEQPCPANADDSNPDWQPYRLRIDWTLSSDFGSKVVYVQMCDAAGRTTTSQVSVAYANPAEGQTATPVNQTPGPDVLGIAHATQTAAASATAYAPVLETVQAILTATASAP